MMAEKLPKCYKCGNVMHPSSLSQHLVTSRDGHPVVCLDVPIHRCPNDGEVYFSSATAKVFDQIRQGKLSTNNTAVVELPAVSMKELLAGATNTPNLVRE